MTEELDGAQIAELMADLIALKDSLESLLESTEAGENPVKLKDNQGRLSRMDEMHNQSILKANRNLTRNRLKEVIGARSRLGDNSYGCCVECGEDIGYARLKAYPEAAMCLMCKASHES